MKSKKHVIYRASTGIRLKSMEKVGTGSSKKQGKKQGKVGRFREKNRENIIPTGGERHDFACIIGNHFALFSVKMESRFTSSNRMTSDTDFSMKIAPCLKTRTLPST